MAAPSAACGARRCSAWAAGATIPSPRTPTSPSAWCSRGGRSCTRTAPSATRRSPRTGPAGSRRSSAGRGATTSRWRATGGRSSSARPSCAGATTAGRRPSGTAVRASRCPGEAVSMLPFLGLLALATAWFLLPLVPALRELARPTDIAPLKVVDRSSGYVAYFARNFRRYLEKQTAALPQEQQVGDFFGRLPDGTQLVRVHKAADALE